MGKTETKITIRKSVRPEIAEKIPMYIEKVISWLKEKYPYVKFDNVDYIFSSSFSRSRYFRNNIKKDKYPKPNACISTRADLILYEKKSLKIKNRKLFVGYDTQIECALVHELTHHVQHEQKHRVGNELDTTANELEYLKTFYTEHYNKVMGIKK